MCELFGVSAREKLPVNELLREFFSHSVAHPNGWGMAVFYGNSASVEKEPVPAYKSAYLKSRLQHPLAVYHMIAHIRLATVGALEFENCHPFVRRDNCGRTWTLAHNGTIFDAPALSPYVHTQEGSTDSERILYYVVDAIDDAQRQAGRPLDADERFGLLDRIVCQLAPHNKLNLLLYDSEQMYVHTNYANSLYVKQLDGAALFATVPLSPGGWRPLGFTTLFAYRDGQERRRGTNHGCEYFDDPSRLKFLFTDYAGL